MSRPRDYLVDSWMTFYRSDAEQAYRQDHGLETACRQAYSLEDHVPTKEAKGGWEVNPILRNYLSGHKQFCGYYAAVSLL